ncbi:MAG: hypothetical protein R2690_20045 [Acidimicrobiales bacterium]
MASTTDAAPGDEVTRPAADLPAAPGRWAWLVPAAAVAWSAYVWVTRIANAWSDEGLGVADQVATTALSLSFLVLAVGVALAALHLRSGRAPNTVDRWSMWLLAGWSIAVWAVRVPQILAADHSVPFKAVHAVLGLVSIGLALALLRVAGRWVAAHRSSADDAAADPGLLGGRC